MHSTDAGRFAVRATLMRTTDMWSDCASSNGVEGAETHHGTADKPGPIRRVMVFAAPVANSVIALVVLSKGLFKPEEFRLDPGRSLYVLGMLFFPALLAAFPSVGGATRC